MFGDTLLESSSTGRKGKKWPMATAFTVEAIVAAVVVIVPLLSTGVIPVSARVPIYTPVKSVTVETERIRTDTTHRSGPATSAPRSDEVVLVSNNPDSIHWGRNKTTTTDPTEAKPPGYGDGPANLPPELIGDGSSKTVVRPGPTRIVSHLSEAQLVNRVEPVYPHVAAVAGIQGQVKLHAIIARDGSIQSLNAISGHPLLVRAALDAVGQWRYRPYYLNGEAVEVETFITVNFRKEAH
ncbi:MAG TPA: energy transducer TonB [Candidatus Angelobacter sp.]|nr:energy transducer TonB [Candidatus Angelobacter sp.]